MTLYWSANGPMPTTAAIVPVTTGTAIKTMLQVATPSTKKIRAVKWGVQLATAPTAPVTCELIQTDVAATVTAAVAAGVQPYSDAGAPASAMTLGASATGHTATAEGATTATRYGDLQIIPIGVSQWVWEWSLGREFDVAASRFLRIRMTTTTAVSATCWVLWDE